MNRSKQFKVAHFSNVPEEELNKYDKIVADVLKSLPDFEKDINHLRSIVGLADTYEYKDVSDLTILLAKISRPKKRHDFENEVEKLIGKYSLTSNWHISISSAVLTGTILVPYPLEPIKIKFPNKTNFSQRYEALARLGHIDKHPGILFTRVVSLNEVNNWLKDNIDYINTLVPKNKIISIDDKALFWGAYIDRFFGAKFRIEKNKPWTKIHTALNNANNKYYENNNEESLFDEVYLEDKTVPSPGKLSQYYTAYINAIKKAELI